MNPFLHNIFFWNASPNQIPRHAVEMCHVKGNNNCYTVIIGEQTFYTDASIYQKAYGVWNGNDLFVLESSDIGPTEFRRANGVWRATPEEHLQRTTQKAKETNP